MEDKLQEVRNPLALGMCTSERHKLAPVLRKAKELQLRHRERVYHRRKEEVHHKERVHRRGKEEVQLLVLHRERVHHREKVKRWGCHWHRWLLLSW